MEKKPDFNGKLHKTSALVKLAAWNERIHFFVWSRLEPSYVVVNETMKQFPAAQGVLADETSINCTGSSPANFSFEGPQAMNLLQTLKKLLCRNVTELFLFTPKIPIVQLIGLCKIKIVRM